MDWFESLLPLLIFAIYFLSQLRRARQRAQRAASETPAASASPAPPATPSPFEELIRQIQEAARESQQPRPAAPAAVPPPAPPPAPRLPARPLPVAGDEFRDVGAFEHDRHGFGPASPFSEERFEHLARGADVTAHAPGHLDYSPHGTLRPSDPQRQPHPLAARLKRPGTARDAFVLHEVLRTPRARRRG
jgi:hypothetical protein